MRIVSGENFRENQNTYFMFSNYFSKIVTWKNMVGPGRPQMAI